MLHRALVVTVLLGVVVHAQAGWTNLGGGIAGSHGIPRFIATGTLQAGDPVTLAVASAKPSSVAGLLASLTLGPVNFKGGQLIPAPPLAIIPLGTDGLGGVILSGNWPLGIPPATNIYMQFAFKDSAAIKGVSVSNALRATTPGAGGGSVEIIMWGAGGASGALDGSVTDGKPGGGGGYAQASFDLPAGTELRVLVGEGGQLADIGGGGGGGRCDVSMGPALSPSWLLVAGGGGGGSRSDNLGGPLGNAGGPGGGTDGSSGLVVGGGGGGGGTQVANGAGGFPGGHDGSALQMGGDIDGNGGDGGGYGLMDGQPHYPSGHAWGGGGAGDGDNFAYTSGGGGGGWHGGGGGATKADPVQNYGGGGGGGSGHVDASAVSQTLLAGGQPSMPWVAANAGDPLREDDAGAGGQAGAAGADGLVWIRVNGGAWNKFTPTTGPEGTSPEPIVHVFVVP